MIAVEVHVREKRRNPLTLRQEGKGAVSIGRLLPIQIALMESLK